MVCGGSPGYKNINKTCFGINIDIIFPVDPLYFDSKQGGHHENF